MNTTSLEQIKAQLMAQRPTPSGLSALQSIGVNEAPGMPIKAYLPPHGRMDNTPMPVGGIDMSLMQPGQQMMPAPPQPPQGAQGQPPQAGGAPAGPTGPTPPMGNMLSMTPQGQAMSAMRPPAPNMPPKPMADGGGVSGSGGLQLNVPLTAGGGGGGGGQLGGLGDLSNMGTPAARMMQSPKPSTLGDMTGGTDVSPMLPQPLMRQQQNNQPDSQDMLQKMMEAFSKAQQANQAQPDMGQAPNTNKLAGITGMAEGGSMGEKSVSDMEDEMKAKGDPSTRVQIAATGPNGVKGIVVPRHMLEGNSWINKQGNLVNIPGMREVNEARAKVYGPEPREPLTIGKIGREHEKTLENHFQQSHAAQVKAEKAALERLRLAKHVNRNANTLDKSEKLDTVNHEHDDQGRSYMGLASKGVAGHSLYTSGHGDQQQYKVVNTCPGQTAGCGGGTDANGIVDTSKGTCFAPNAEQQYVAASVRRAAHEQAKHDPAMTNDWILAHTGSLRDAAKQADRKNKRLLFRPNVVDETDVSSRHVIRHLNAQRKEAGKPPIIANSYGKTTELHDPENGYYVTHSNVGPKTKKGSTIAENIARDQQRVRQTILGTENKRGDDLVNAQGNKTPPKNSYMVTDVKRYSPFDKRMQEAITHAKYWSSGRAPHELTQEEKKEGPEGHFDAEGKPTTPELAHYGHTTLDDEKTGALRYDYQKQHILHPRLVNVPERKKNKKTGKIETVEHMIPTDSRFLDENFLPKERFKTKTGKLAGAILMTTPTESTSNVGHQTSFTHHVGEQHIEHAQKNNGEYEIDHPKDQVASLGNEYVPPQPIKFMKKMANGGTVGSHVREEFDEHMAFPEQSFAAQHRLSYRHDPSEVHEIGHLPYHAGAQNIAAMAAHAHKGKVTVHKDLDTMAYELSRKPKAK